MCAPHTRFAPRAQQVGACAAGVAGVKDTGAGVTEVTVAERAGGGNHSGREGRAFVALLASNMPIWPAVLSADGRRRAEGSGGGEQEGRRRQTAGRGGEGVGRAGRPALCPPPRRHTSRNKQEMKERLVFLYTNGAAHVTRSPTAGKALDVPSRPQPLPRQFPTAPPDSHAMATTPVGCARPRTPQIDGGGGDDPPPPPPSRAATSPPTASAAWMARRRSTPTARRRRLVRA